MFRDMLDHGRPGLFLQTIKRDSPCRVPPRFCELQFVRLRHVAISIEVLSSAYRGNKKSVDALEQNISNIKSQLLQLTTAVMKGVNMRSLRIMIYRRLGQDTYLFDRPAFAWQEYSQAQTDRRMQGIIRPLIEMALTKDMIIGIEERRQYKSAADEDKPALYSDETDDPLVAWANAIIPLEKRMGSLFPYFMNTSFMQFDHESQEMVMRPWRPWDSGVYPEEFVEEEKVRFAEAMKQISKEDAGYSLVPECRHIRCNALFESEAELKKHLDERPDHRIPYVRKPINRTHREAICGGRYTCLTCAKSFMKLGWYHEHLEKSRHSRKSIPPRWRQDNKWYERREANWKPKW